MAKCQRSGSTEVLWVELDRVGPVELDQFPDLKIVATPCTGTDHIDVAECHRRGIEVLSVTGWPGLRDVHGTAEHTVLLMLAALRGWYPTRQRRPGRTLHGKRVGILGMGRVGTQVARLVEGFGATVVPDGAADCEVVSLHMPLNESTRGFVNEARLDRWNQGTVLVNTARGGLVVVSEVVQALDTGQLGWYASDFSCGLMHARMSITPHVAGWTVEGVEATQAYLAKLVVSTLERG